MMQPQKFAWLTSDFRSASISHNETSPSLSHVARTWQNWERRRRSSLIMGCVGSASGRTNPRAVSHAPAHKPAVTVSVTLPPAAVTGCADGQQGMSGRSGGLSPPNACQLAECPAQRTMSAVSASATSFAGSKTTDEVAVDGTPQARRDAPGMASHGTVLSENMPAIEDGSSHSSSHDSDHFQKTCTLLGSSVHSAQEGCVVWAGTGAKKVRTSLVQVGNDVLLETVVPDVSWAACCSCAAARHLT